MSEQALRPLSVTAVSVTDRSLAGTQRTNVDGKTSPEVGTKLPESNIPKRNLVQLAQEMNVTSKNIGRDLRFQVDLELGYAVIEVLDRETGELIRQIPPEKAALVFANDGSANLRLFDDLV